MLLDDDDRMQEPRLNTDSGNVTTALTGQVSVAPLAIVASSFMTVISDLDEEDKSTVDHIRDSNRVMQPKVRISHSDPHMDTPEEVTRLHAPTSKPDLSVDVTAWMDVIGRLDNREEEIHLTGQPNISPDPVNDDL